MADATWLALNVVSGGGSFSSSQPIGVTKIAKSVIAPLADQNISVFMLSTYQTDFILVSKLQPTPRQHGHPLGCGLQSLCLSPPHFVISSERGQGYLRVISPVSAWPWLGCSPTHCLPFAWTMLGLSWRPGSEGWGRVWVGCPPSWMSGSPSPIPLPGVASVSSRGASGISWLPCYSCSSPIGRGHPGECGPGRGRDRCGHHTQEGVGGVDLHLLALGAVSSPLCILPAAPGEACAPGPRLPSQDSGRQGQGKLVLGTESQSEGAGDPGPTPSRDHGTLTL